jgi:hypothetical protein
MSAGLLGVQVAGNPYEGIASRNVFRLRPSLYQEQLPAPVLLPRVTLNGITTILGDRRALLRVTHPAQPPEPATEMSCILAVGQREGPVEVLVIDETAGSITINNSGTVMVLTLAKDSPQPQAMPRTVPPSPPPR